MTAALEGTVSVGVDWGLPLGSTALPPLATSANVRPGDVARLYSAWLPASLGGADHPWTLAAAHVTIRRGDGLSVRIPVAPAAEAATEAAAVPFYETAGRNVAILAVKVRPPFDANRSLLSGSLSGFPSRIDLRRTASVRSRPPRTASLPTLHATAWTWVQLTG